MPLGLASAGANRNDPPLRAPTLEQARARIGALPVGLTVHLDGAYDGGPTRALLDTLGFVGEIAREGVPAPVQASRRWPVERAHAWMNTVGELHRCTDHDGRIVDFYLYLAAALVVVRQLIQRARTLYRRDARPITRRLR